MRHALKILPWMGCGLTVPIDAPYIKKPSKKYKDHVLPETRTAWDRMREEEAKNPPPMSRQVRRRIERPWKQVA